MLIIFRCVYSAYSQLYCVKFSFKLANISRSYDGCSRGPLFIGTQCISDHPLPKYDVTQIFQYGGCGGSILFPVSYLLMPLYSEGQNLSANQILSTYLNSWLRYNYFRFGNRNVCIYEFCFRFRFRSYHAICMLLNFIQTGPPAAEI